MNNGQGSAFPYNGIALGLTKREYFAVMAMQSIIAVNGTDTYHLSKNTEGVTTDIAEAAIKVADELLKQL